MTDNQGDLFNLSRFMDHELDSKTEKQVRSHLNSCKPCRDELKLYRLLQNTIKSTGKKTTSPPPFNGPVNMAFSNAYGSTIPEKITGFCLLFPIRTMAAAQVILLLFGLTLGILVYGRTGAQPTLSAAGRLEMGGLFDAVYPGSLAESFLFLENEHE